MDEQRCSFSKLKGVSRETPSAPQKEELMDEIAKLQGNRLNEQRSSIRSLPGLRTNNDEVLGLLKKPVPEALSDNEDFFDMLMKCQVGFEPINFRIVSSVPN